MQRLITTKELAYQAIAKHSRRIFKHQAGVLKDQDPENLHQMRVGMRRLRSAIAEKLPELADLFLKTQSQKWLEWQISQKQFLTAKTRT
jgi:CHAD domain-containing protein